MSTFSGCTVDCPTGDAHFDETCARREYSELEHLIGGLARYFNAGIMPGHFLTAVLMNDLQEACSRADLETFAVMPRLMKLLFNHAPSTAHGSRDHILSWRKRLRSEAAK